MGSLSRRSLICLFTVTPILSGAALAAEQPASCDLMARARPARLAPESDGSPLDGLGDRAFGRFSDPDAAQNLPAPTSPIAPAAPPTCQSVVASALSVST